LHRPVTQLCAELFVVAHASPQPPQWAASAFVSVSQPSSVAPGVGPLQSAEPAMQAWPHWPALHI
jgi:hypothetical protein